MGLLRNIGWNEFVDTKAVKDSLDNLTIAINSYYEQQDETNRQQVLKAINIEKNNLEKYATKASAQYKRNCSKFEKYQKKGNTKELNKYGKKKEALNNLIQKISDLTQKISISNKIDKNCSLLASAYDANKQAKVVLK